MLVSRPLHNVWIVVSSIVGVVLGVEALITPALKAIMSKAVAQTDQGELNFSSVVKHTDHRFRYYMRLDEFLRLMFMASVHPLKCNTSRVLIQVPYSPLSLLFKCLHRY